MKRIFSILTAVCLLAGLAIAIAPVMAHAATGMATIDISTLGDTDADNVAASATESEWAYDGTLHVLNLNTEGGNYTLTGANPNLGVWVIAENVNLTLNGVDMTRPGDATYFAAISGNDSSDGLTITLVGSNTITGGAGSPFGTTSKGGGLVVPEPYFDWTITSADSGNLTAKGYYPSNHGIDFQFIFSQVLRITGNATVNAVGGANGSGMSQGPLFLKILIGDNARLTITNNYTGALHAEHTVWKADTATTHKWKLTDAATLGALTDDSITITVASGTTATIERERIPVSPAIATATLPGGTVGTAYNQSLAATGDTPITWTRDSGALPGGLSISAAGVISGTPTVAGTFNFTVKVANGAGNAIKALSITIAAQPKGIFGTQPQYTQWWHYLLFFLCFGFIWMWF